jgi:phosphinothricin acetyltransferase
MQVRAAQSEDDEAIAAVYAPFVVETAVSFELVPPDAREMAARRTALPSLPWLVVELDRRVAGFAYATPFRARAAYQWSVEVSVYLAASAQRRGAGSELYRALLAELARLGYIRAFAGIALPDPASVRLHEKLGFRPVGSYPGVGYKLGAWHDVGWWSRPLVDPVPAQPSRPLEWRA